jgi:hypothetical protein
VLNLIFADNLLMINVIFADKLFVINLILEEVVNYNKFNIADYLFMKILILVDTIY